MSGHRDTVLALLREARGAIVPHATLIAALWPNPDLEPEYPEATVKVLICQLRKQGHTITTVWRRGYRLVEAAPAPAA